MLGILLWVGSFCVLGMVILGCWLWVLCWLLIIRVWADLAAYFSFYISGFGDFGFSYVLLGGFAYLVGPVIWVSLLKLCGYCVWVGGVLSFGLMCWCVADCLLSLGLWASLYGS